MRVGWALARARRPWSPRDPPGGQAPQWPAPSRLQNAARREHPPTHNSKTEHTGTGRGCRLPAPCQPTWAAGVGAPPARHARVHRLGHADGRVGPRRARLALGVHVAAHAAAALGARAGEGVERRAGARLAPRAEVAVLRDDDAVGAAGASDALGAVARAGEAQGADLRRNDRRAARRFGRQGSATKRWADPPATSRTSERLRHTRGPTARAAVKRRRLSPGTWSYRAGSRPGRAHRCGKSRRPPPRPCPLNKPRNRLPRYLVRYRQRTSNTCSRRQRGSTRPAEGSAGRHMVGGGRDTGHLGQNVSEPPQVPKACSLH